MNRARTREEASFDVALCGADVNGPLFSFDDRSGRCEAARLPRGQRRSPRKDRQRSRKPLRTRDARESPSPTPEAGTSRRGAQGPGDKTARPSAEADRGRNARQSRFPNPDAEIIKTSNKGFDDSGNGREVADDEHQISVVADVTAAAKNKQQAAPLAATKG